jgi:hypothetical protein
MFALLPICFRIHADASCAPVTKLPKTYRAALEHLIDGQAKPIWSFPRGIGRKKIELLLPRGWIVRIVDRRSGEERFQITDLGGQIVACRYAQS